MCALQSADGQTFPVRALIANRRKLRGAEFGAREHPGVRRHALNQPAA